MKAVFHVSTSRSCRRQGRAASFVLKALPAALALAFVPAWADPAAINAGGAAGLPVNGVVSSGTASGALAGNLLTVTQTTDRAVIDWSAFNIDAGKTVQFVQPSAGAVLNRVSAATNASQISGTLSANGMVMLMNPHGIVFNQGASVNVGALIATTGTIDENTFSKNGAQITGATAGSITNAGNITATAGANGLVAMVAPSVINQGVIAATGGSIALLGSTAATISLNNGLYEFAIPGGGGATGAEVTNAAGASLNAKTLYLGVGDAANLLSGTINLEGVQQASSAIVVNGDTVVLKSALQAASVSGNSNTVSVSGTARIQDGVNIVKSGGAVNVASGTYVQTKTLTIDKSLTLTGAGQGETIIDAKGVTDYGMNVTADNVTLKDFTLYGPTANVSSSYGVKVAPSGGTAARVRDFSISNVTIRGSGRAELDLNGVVGAVIDNVTADGAPVGDDIGNTAGAGIQITDSADVTVRNSTTRNNQWGGLALYQANTYYDQQVNNIKVEASNNFAELNPVYLQDQSVSLNFGTLDIAGFGHAVRNNASSSTNQYTWLQASQQKAFDFAVNLASSNSSYIQGWNGGATTQNFHVGIGNLQAGGSRAMSIGTAVSAASSGATVNVAAGTYSENVVINKALTMNGAGAAQSIIKPTTGDAVTVSGNIGAGSSVLIDGFTFSGGNVAGSSGSGVKVASGTTLGQLTLQNSIFRDSGIFGFYAAGTSTAGLSGVGKVVLQDSSFTNNGNTAGGPTALGLGDIQFNYYNGDATLKNVHVTGTGEHTGIHFRGYHDAGGAVKNAGNVVFDNVVVDGTFRRPGGSVGTWNPDGPGYGIHFFEYDSVANVSFNDVKISNTVGHGLAVEGLGSTLDIGNTRFDLADTSVVGTGSNPTASLNIVTGGNSQNNVKTNVKATAASFTGAQNGFDIEDRVGHALDANGVGLVTWSAGNVYVTQKSASVQRGVDAATAGDTVNVGAGTFVENVTINKALTLDGAGSTQTVIKAPSSASGTAVTINNASNVTLSDLQIADSFYGLQMSGTSNNATVNRVAFNNNSYGVRNGTNVRADNFRMLNSTVTGGLVGVQAYNNASNTASFANALFENVTIDGPTYKGFYFETADNLTLRNVTIRNAGNVGESTSHENGSAIDINLKYGAFNALTLDNVVVQDSGQSSGYADRAAVVIKTRGVPGDTAYASTPASLQSVNIIGGSIEGSKGNFSDDGGTGLRIETLRNAQGGQTQVRISGGTRFSGNGKDIAVGNTSVDARGAVFAGAADGFAIEDRVTHALDTSGRGLVTWNAGNVYVTQKSGSVQRGVDAAGAGDLVNVANASFAENVTVNARRDLAFNDTRLQSLTLGSGAAGSGIGGAVTAEGAGGFNFDKGASIRLLSDTTLTTTGADIALRGDIQNDGGVARALRLVAGTGTTLGNVLMTTGGSEFAALGRFDISAKNFDLASTLWVSGYKIDAKGYVALSNSTLRAQDVGAVNTLSAGGDVTGATNSKGTVEIVSGGNIVAKITATELVAKAAGSIDAVLNVAKSAAFESGGATNVSGSAPVIAVNAPSGSVSGSFGTVNNTGTGLVNINGKPQGNTTLSSNTENNRVVPGGNLADGGGEGGGLQLAQAGGALSANGSELSLSTPEAAGDAIDSGRSVELDMSPRKQRTQDKSADNSTENDKEKDKE